MIKLVSTYKALSPAGLFKVGRINLYLAFRKKYSAKCKRIILALLILIFFLVLFLCSLPKKLFTDPLCTVITDRNNRLLGAHIADDGQWRFPPGDSVSLKFEKSILAFEDKRFYYHPGFDIIAIFRALRDNFMAGKIISGGSTISMQVIRLYRKGKSRTVTEKIIEAFLALRLETRFSKSQILNLYASNAPFGGNVVGINAAAWRYFGRSAANLSWAESAMLAVLPNSPALIHPGRNRRKLYNKRNDLLADLNKNGDIDKETYELAIEEPIPNKPKAFPQCAPHLLTRIMLENENPEAVFKTSINKNTQIKANQIVNRHQKVLSGKGIYNIAAIIIHVESNKVIAYIGNVDTYNNLANNGKVDVIMAERSTGSILKPFLYAGLLTSGDILPNTLITDVPTYFSGYTPKNYNLGYDGAVPAHRALARSLNIPAAYMLQKYGLEKFHSLLKKLGMTSIHKQPSHYGLALVLGGCEGKLWDLTGIYASMARSLNHFQKYSGRYNLNDYKKPDLLMGGQTKYIKDISKLPESSILTASSIWFTFKAMIDVERPEEEGNWQDFTSSERIAWKTGTSFGFRDAWAIGVTPDYVVGVWTGNADGEGRPELIGVRTAAPVLFDIFDILPLKSKWFEKPYDDMIQSPVCIKSGYLAGQNCDQTENRWIPANGIRSGACPYHKIIHLDKTESYRVNSNCESVDSMVHKSWFILPPKIEKFYKIKHISYQPLPAFRSDCLGTSDNEETKAMQMVYPQSGTQIFIPKEISGNKGRSVFEVAHRKPNTTIYWYIDENFVGETKRYHKLEILCRKGKHILTLVDEYGENLKVKFEILDKDE